MGFQFLDFYSSKPILSSSIMTSSFVRNQILLLHSFHKVPRNWEKISLGFAKDIIIKFNSSSIVTEEVFALAREENKIVISAYSLKAKTNHVYPRRVVFCFRRIMKRATGHLLKEMGGAKNQICDLFPRNPDKVGKIIFLICKNIKCLNSSFKNDISLVIIAQPFPHEKSTFLLELCLLLIS